MSTAPAHEPRVPTKAGYANLKSMPRGPRGFPLCRQCGKETPSKRRTFCGESCVEAWKCTTRPSHQRHRVWERDAGVCQVCGIDTVEQRVAIFEVLRDRLQRDGVWREGDALVWRSKPFIMRAGRGVVVTPEQTAVFYAAIAEARLSGCMDRLRRGPVWDMDHIVPVAEGGGSCGLENLRTLCRACHLDATKQLRRRLADKRLRRREAAQDVRD